MNGTLKCQIKTFRRGIRPKPSSLFKTFLGTWFLGSLPFLDSDWLLGLSPRSSLSKWIFTNSSKYQPKISSFFLTVLLEAKFRVFITNYALETLVPLGLWNAVICRWRAVISWGARLSVGGAQLEFYQISWLFRTGGSICQFLIRNFC